MREFTVISKRSIGSLGLALFLLGACHSKETGYFGNTTPQHPPDTLWINLNGEPEYVDPGKAADSVAGEIDWNIFAGLLQAHPKSLKPMPEIAKNWDVSKDGRIYTFHLRKSEWSDGKPFTASDFEWSWKRVLDPATGSQYASVFYPVKNAEPFNVRALFVNGVPTGTKKEELSALFPKTLPIERIEFSDWPVGGILFMKGSGAESAKNRSLVTEFIKGKSFKGHPLSAETFSGKHVGITALDDLTLEVRLETSVPYFLSLATHYSLMPVPRHVIERLEKEGINPDLWTLPQYIVTNGPYILKKWKFRQYMDFEKNPHYWDVEHVRSPRVHGIMIESYNTTLNVYAEGGIDWIGTNTSLPAEFMDRLSTYKDFTRDPFLTVYFYWVNTTAPPMNNPNLRKALNLAINREAIVKFVTRSGQIPTANIVPDGLAGYKGLNHKLFDPDRARTYLKEAGYKSGADVPPITVIYNTSEGHKQIAEAVQQMWKKELGIDARIENQEWKVFLRNQRMMNFQITRMGWVGDYPDPYTFLDLFLPNNENNHSNWKSKEYEILLRKANQILVPEKRMAALREAEAYMTDMTPVFPFYVYTRSQLIKPYLMGFWPNFQDRNPWKNFWIDTRWYKGIPTEPVDNSPPPEYQPVITSASN